METRHKFLTQECLTMVKRKTSSKVCDPIFPTFLRSRPMRRLCFSQTRFLHSFKPTLLKEFYLSFMSDLKSKALYVFADLHNER